MTYTLQSMASTDMDLGQLDTFLGSQVRKKEGGITEEQSKVYMKFWRSNRHKIHQSLVSNATWNNKLKNLSWRIDVKSRARHVDQINTPVAIVELQLAQGSSQQKVGVDLRYTYTYNLSRAILGKNSVRIACM